MTAPSPDLQEALRRANLCRPFPDPSVRERDFLTLADEIYRLRDELADETKHRLVLAATLESDWAELNAAMMPVVRAAEHLREAAANDDEDGYPRFGAPAYERLLLAAHTFRATGFLPDIELEDSDHG